MAAGARLWVQGVRLREEQRGGRRIKETPMSPNELSEKIKAEALALGFFACGIAKAGPVDSRAADRLLRWLDCGGYAGMAYMANHTDKRLDPRLLMPGLKSIVCVALNYTPGERIPENEYQLAAYAYGNDYHDVVKGKLHLLAGSIGRMVRGQEEACRKTGEDGTSIAYRAFCDSAPVLERYWAVQAGLGWTGRNHQLIIPHAGSMFFLGELFLDLELTYDSPMRERCGNCRACIDACPTRALCGCETFLAERCLSYQTIENRGPLSPEAAAAMKNTIYGCDRCQQVCPWNRFATPTTEPRLQPKPELLGMTKEAWLRLSADDYRRLFKGSAVKRAKYEGLVRNIEAVAKVEDNVP